MNCKNHFNFDAGYACVHCGQPICLQCTVELNNKYYCKECLEKYIHVKPAENKVLSYRKKSKFLTLCFGIVPGAGHMYLGLINKGLMLMGFYFGILFSATLFSDLLRIHWLPGFVIPTLSVLCICYSVFHSLSVLDDINAGRPVNDSNFTEINFIKDRILYKKNSLGYILLGLGLLSLFNIFARTIDHIMINIFDFSFSLSSLILPAVFIFLGLYLIRRGTRNY